MRIIFITIRTLPGISRDMEQRMILGVGMLMSEWRFISFSGGMEKSITHLESAWQEAQSGTLKEKVVVGEFQ